MLRRYLSTLQLGSELFPTAQAALAPADPWCLPNAQLKKGSSPAPSTPAAQLAAVLVKHDYLAGWHLFTQSRHPFNVEMLSKLLAALPSGAETAHVWWPRALQIKQALDARNARLPPSDYAVLINLASKAGRNAAVNSLWREMIEQRIERDTNVWNQYIMAACDANPQFWPWERSRSTSFARQQAAVLTKNRKEAMHNNNNSPSTNSSDSLDPNLPDSPPPASSSISFLTPRADILSLLERMDLEGVGRNSRTYELTVLALAREGSNERLEACTQIIEHVWGSYPQNSTNKGKMEPGLSTLTAIINSFAFHSRLEEGYALARRVGGPLLGVKTASEFWTRLFRLAVAQTEPRGNLPTQFFDSAWQDMTEKDGFKPRIGEWSIRMEFLEMKNRFDDMFDALPQVLLTAGGSLIATGIATRAATGLANTERALDALKRLQNARKLGIEPSRDMDAFLADRGASAEQLQMFEEDDDEDGFTGSHLV